MKLNERIESFSELGETLRKSVKGEPTDYTKSLNQLIGTQHLKNPWFTPENVRTAMKAIADELTYNNLTKWISSYPDLNHDIKSVKAGIVMAGNIPLVGFHDYLSVLISGNEPVIKTSSKDPDLIVFVNEILCNINPGFKEKIHFADGTISGFDVVIATGSDNSSRYFEYYFGRYPSIIRKNRSSIAIIDGKETDEELQALGSDIFTYFGLGCRNVSKIYIPAGYDLNLLTKNWNQYSNITNHTKYGNNYDYNKAVYIINKEKIFDFGFILLNENRGLSSPIAVLYFEYYNSIDEVNRYRLDLKEKIQCTCGRNHIPFGKAQSPALWEYADGIDAIEFLLKKNIPGIL